MILFFLIPFSVQGEELNDRVIIAFYDEIDFELLEQPSIDIHHVFEELKAVSATIPSEFKQDLLKHPNVKYVEADSIVKTTNQTANWGYNTLNIQTAKSMGLTGNGIKIAILDTGINLDHPDLKISGGQSFVEGISTFDDDFGHGTHVAGIIAAQDNEIGTIGVAPDSQIYSVKVLNKFGEGVQSNVIAGINWAIEQQMDVINLSITSQQGSYLLKEALQKAYDKGIIIVAASGNYPTNNIEGTDVLYPARYPSVIAVGSIDENLKKSSFSYYGNSLDFVAPGEKIRSTYIENSDFGYSELTGTSMAAPYVAGIAALYMQQYPMMSNVEIRHLMQRNAMDLGENGERHPVWLWTCSSTYNKWTFHGYD